MRASVAHAFKLLGVKKSIGKESPVVGLVLFTRQSWNIDEAQQQAASTNTPHD
jgi:hypothetical protein